MDRQPQTLGFDPFFRPLSFSDIVEKLEISKGSASQGLQVLRSLGAINESGVSVDGERLPVDGAGPARRVAFEPELSLRKLMSGILQERLAPLAATGADRIVRLRKLAEREGEGNAFYLDRARQLNTWRRRLNTVLPVLGALLGPKNSK